jgi:hypothetical protein
LFRDLVYLLPVQAPEDIPFDRVRQQKATQQEKKQAIDFQQAMQSNDKVAVSGRWERPGSKQAAK